MKIANLVILNLLTASLVLLSGCSEEDGVAGTGGGSSSSGLGPSIPTGKINAAGFFLLYDTESAIVYSDDLSYTQKDVTITVNADDVNDLLIPSGQTVKFRTEWGTFVGDNKDSCVITNGQCSVTWRSGDPATGPQDCRVAITAWASGEESFFDINDNDLFDQNVAEVLYDLGEPFLDIDSDGVWDATLSTFEGVGELIDIEDFDGSSGNDATYTAGDGEYTGSLCASGNTRCSGRSSMIIHDRLDLLIQTPFVDTDGNYGTNTTDPINFCNFSSY